MDRALPMNTGAEAVETAIKAARKWAYKVKGVPAGQARNPGRRGQLRRPHHDDHQLLERAAVPRRLRPVHARLSQRAVRRRRPRSRRRSAPNTAAFIVEPVQGEAGIIVPPVGYLAAVREICTRRNVLMIADEVQTGLGRTGRILACDHEGVRPDGLTLGKALGGGLLPVSAFCAREDVMAVFNPGDHGSTFGGNPLGAAVGEAALTLLEHGPYCETARVQGDHLLGATAPARASGDHRHPRQGPLRRVEIDPAFAGARRVCDALVDEGVLTKDTHGTVVRMAPPLTIEPEQIDQAVVALGRALASIEAAEPIAA